MITAILGFFSAVFKFLLGLATAIIDWVREHPRAFLEIIVALVLALMVYGVTKGETTKKVWAEANKIIAAQKVEVDKANAETAKRDAKIKEIEEHSKAAAEELSRQLIESEQKAKGIVSDYEKKLAAERANYHVIYVKDKDGKDVSVTVDQQGSVMCDKFSQTFFDTVNGLVTNSNSPLGLKPSTNVQVTK